MPCFARLPRIPSILSFPRKFALSLHGLPHHGEASSCAAGTLHAASAAASCAAGTLHPSVRAAPHPRAAGRLPAAGLKFQHVSSWTAAGKFDDHLADFSALFWGGGSG